MANNKVQLLGGEVLLDVSEDSVTPDKLAAGETAHNAAGERIVGTYVPPVTSVNGKTGAVMLGKDDVGLGNVPNVSTNNQTPTYTVATTLAKLTSGEKLSAAMGKIAKAITDLISHIGNKNNPHGVTAAQIKALPLTGGTLTGNLTGKYITGTWLQTTEASDKAGDFATIDSSGWIYKRTPDETASDIGVTHQNLFVNGNFQIWQRYPSGTYTGVPNNRYIADRWIILSSDGNKTNTFTAVDPCGIHNESNGASCTFTQHIKNASMYNGWEMTYSVLKSDSSGNVSLTSTTKKASGWTDTTDIGAFFGTDSAHRWIGPGETVYGVKLEIGSAQTLAHKVNGVWVLNEIPSVTTELLRCKRFFTQINGGALFKRADVGYNNSTFQFFIPVGVEMVANPSVSGTPKIYSAGKASSGLTQVSGFSFSYATLSNGVIRVIATKSSHGLADAAIGLEPGFQFTADV